MVPLILNALNLQKLLIEVFKVIMKLALETLDDGHYGMSISSWITFVGSRIWRYIPSELKESTTLKGYLCCKSIFLPQSSP